MKTVCVDCGKPIYIFPSYLKRRGGASCTRRCQECHWVKTRRNVTVVIRERVRFGTQYVKRTNRWRIWFYEGGASLMTTMYIDRFIMECSLGRSLEPHERVVCKNGNSSDHRPENLYLTSSLSETTSVIVEQFLNAGLGWGTNRTSIATPNEIAQDERARRG